eukprot:TRINITY_DN1969_c0_g2_i1.p1 TRINITY_DN1969_c0_g2~~TRINITY_DN1969_c0_g2_i1.p1  ORF type:complete len:152 (-),score=11.25 TRINITY_DN1969_c0_g2_i1:222-677(-)
MSLSYVFVVCLFLASVCNSNVLLKKSISLTAENPVPTTDKDLILTLEVYNTGDRPVYDVDLRDPAPKDFAVVSGLTRVFWPTLAAGQNYSHNYVIRATKTGDVIFGIASVTYKEVPGGPDFATYSNFVGSTEVLSTSNRDEFSGPHFVCTT